MQNRMFTVQEKCCCVVLMFFNLECSAMLVFLSPVQCKFSRSMLGLTAFYLIPRFAHTLKFQSNDVLTVVKVHMSLFGKHI